MRSRILGKEQPPAEVPAAPAAAETLVGGVAEIAHCLNCDAALGEGHRFCAQCGQKAIVGRLTVREIVHDFWHALMHVDRSALALVRMLLSRPGYVARDYVEGKRKLYFGPFAFLVIIVGLASAAISVSGVSIITIKELGSTSLQALLCSDALTSFFHRHDNAVILLETPLLAAFTRLLFRKDGTNFAEQLVLASYTSGLQSLFITLIVIPFSFIFRLHGTNFVFFQIVFSLVWFGYFGLAATQFSREHSFVSGLKGVLAAALTWSTSQIVLSAIALSFIWYSAR